MDPRSAAAQAGYVDVELLLFSCAKAFGQAKSWEDLDAAWKDLVKPVQGQLSDTALSILESLFALNLTVIGKGRADG